MEPGGTSARSGDSPPPRKHLRRHEVHLGRRFLTCSCNQRLALFDDDAVKDEFVAVLALARERHAFRLIAWVLMPEHFHLLIVPTAGLGSGSGVPAILIGLKKTLADRVLRAWRRQGSPWLDRIRTARGDDRFWQAGGGFDRNIRDAEELARTIDYIHQNPVTRGLVPVPTDWRWSSARWYAGLRDGTLPIDSLDFRQPGPGFKPTP